MIWIVSSSLAQTRISLPSLVMVMPRGRWPTGTVLTVFIWSRSMTLIVLSRSFVT